MGVIHKLTDEVINFIIDHKKNNPRISVRKLSEVTSAKFNTNISKSSVSTVLKNASMSSAVGRRPEGKSNKPKFAIPPKQKDRISKNMEKFGVSKSDAPAPKKDKEPEDKPLPLIPDPVAEKPKPPEIPIDKPETRPESVPADQDFLNYVKQLRAQRHDGASQTLPGMGFVFLKAAQWEISNRPVLATVFQKHYNAGGNKNIFDAAVNCYLMLNFLGAKDAGRIEDYRDHGWTHLNRKSYVNVDEKDLFNALKGIYDWQKSVDERLIRAVSMAHKLESQQAFMLVNRFKLFLEDDSALYFDAALTSVSRNQLAKVRSNNRLPVSKALAWLSSYLVSSVEPLALPADPGIPEFDPAVFELIGAFENTQGKKTVKASVLDDINQTLAEFTTVPRQKRHLLIGVAPGQKEFTQLMGNVKWAGKKPYYHQPTDAIYHWAETKPSGLSQLFGAKPPELRVITVWRDGQKDPYRAVLTNEPQRGAEQLLESYLSGFPYFDIIKEEAPDVGSKPIVREESEGCEKESFAKISLDLVTAQNVSAQRRFFPAQYSNIDVSQMNSMIYETPGTIKALKNEVFVVLEAPDTSARRKDLAYAARRVNECRILDPTGRRLWIEV